MNKESATLPQQAYEYVRGQIINLVFKPGEFITDAQIAEKLAISRTPVREAFQRLEKEGLLVNEARRGWRVYMLDLADIREIFEVKIALEGMLIRKAAQNTDQSLRQDLAEAMEQMKKAAELKNPDLWLQTDIHLHNILFMMADNERAERIVENLNDQWHRLRLGYVALQGRTQTSKLEHEQFVNSVLAGEADKADQQVREHLARVRDDLIELVERIVMPFSQSGF